MSRAPESIDLRPEASAVGIGIPEAPRAGLASWLPGIWMLRHYRRGWLGADLIAGLVLTGLLVPAGMGYAEAAGLPPVTGLYATIIPLVAYALCGPSRIMVLGPDSGLAAMIAAAVIGPAAGDPARAVALAGTLAILVGALCIAGGLAKLGFITDLLSKPVRVGYMNGIALTVLISQLPKLCGFSIDASGVGPAAAAFARGLGDGQLDPIALAIGGGCLVVILGLRALWPRVPGVLIAVVLAIGAVIAIGDAAHLRLVGVVPRGIPAPTIPMIALHDLGPLLIAAIGIALVAFADMSVLSRTFAARNGYRVDANRELIALGLANLAGGWFRGFPITSSASRTPVAEAAGSRTQLTGVVGAIAITTLLLAAPGILADLPTTALAAVVIAAALRLFDLAALRTFWRVRRADFVLAMVAFLAVAALGVLPGIALAVAFSLLDFIRRAWSPHDAVLGRAAGVKGYHDLQRYPDARQVPGLLLFRWDAPLFFANADSFRERVIALVDGAAAPIRWVVIAAEPITDVDTTAAEALAELDRELVARGVALAFAELKDPVKDRLARYGLVATIGAQRFFPTLGVAVKAYVHDTGAAWTDWEG
ncbi:MAG: sulfate permease [Deltaproteobacteria bacterium]|nr:sulfate permease [Deltaproteobacteria bacterium]